MIKRSYFKSLRGKITNRALLLGLLPILLIGGIAYTGLSQLITKADQGINQSRSGLLDEVVGANLSATSNRIVQQLDGFMVERISDVVVWATAPNVIAAAREASAEHEAQELTGLSVDEVEARFANQKSLNLFPATDAYLSSQIARSVHFGEVFITDENGFNVALTNPTSDFVQSDEGWWVSAMDRGIAVGQVQYDESARIWSIDISVRIDDSQTGERLGVMKAVLGVSLIQEVADIRAAEISGGEVTVANQAGLLLAETAGGHSSDRIMTKQGQLTGNSGSAIQEALAGSGSGYVIGDEAVLGYAHSAGTELYSDVLDGFNGFNWLVLVEQPTDIALAPLANLDQVQVDLNSSRRNILLIVGIAIVITALVAILMAHLLANGIITPLHQLQQAAERVAKGDTSAVVSVKSNDEIEDLAGIFERMRNSVAILITRYKKLQSERSS